MLLCGRIWENYRLSDLVLLQSPYRDDRLISIEIEMTRQYIWVPVFWVVYIAAHLVFKFGSTSQGRWLPCLVLGNILGVTSALVLMKNHSLMNPNVAMGLCIGGGFLFAQVALAVAFQSKLSLAQCAGVLAIATGIALLVVCQTSVQRSARAESSEGVPSE